MPSSVIASMSFDPDTGTLRIIYVSGTIYDYLDVPQEVFDEMKAAGSKGVFLNKFIKGTYPYVKVK